MAPEAGPSGKTMRSAPSRRAPDPDSPAAAPTGPGSAPSGPAVARRRRSRHPMTVLLACLVAVSALVAAPAAMADDGKPATPYVFPKAKAASGARVVDVKRLDERTADLVIASPAMGADMPVRVILPRSWHATSKRTYPTVYLLQGASDDYTSWTRETDVEQLAADSDAIIVTPEGGRAGFYTNWYDGGRKDGPKWETFHTLELPQILESGYKANKRRALIGLSEGGLGALNYAGRHPGEYAYAASFSGVVDIEEQATRTFIYLTCAREGIDANKLWGEPARQASVWEAHNPARHPRRLRGVKVHLSAATGLPGGLEGAFDPFAGMLEGPTYTPNVRFASVLREEGVDVTSNFHVTGTHAWPYWQRELHTVWPAVLGALRVNR
ncbi:alpha/beta hydrolase family protein [Streptomyces sp. NPDC051776]|uniref:alpha/beta hydrolase n=1 Tax=Streptomyces sp. NPDC051776 TaxID=3155414 RepID=UPI00342111EA